MLSAWAVNPSTPEAIDTKNLLFATGRILLTTQPKHHLSPKCVLVSIVLSSNSSCLNYVESTHNTFSLAQSQEDGTHRAIPSCLEAFDLPNRATKSSSAESYFIYPKNPRLIFRLRYSVDLLSKQTKSMFPCSDLRKNHLLTTTQIKGGRQRYSIYLSKKEINYRLEISGPEHLSLDDIFGHICVFSSSAAQQLWQKENRALLGQVIAQHFKMRLIRMSSQPFGGGITSVKDNGDEGILGWVPNANFRKQTFPSPLLVIDVGGGLTKLKEEMESGKRDDKAWVEFWGPRDVVADIGGGVKIRICNELEATEQL